MAAAATGRPGACDDEPCHFPPLHFVSRGPFFRRRRSETGFSFDLYIHIIRYIGMSKHNRKLAADRQREEMKEGTMDRATEPARAVMRWLWAGRRCARSGPAHGAGRRQGRGGRDQEALWRQAAWTAGKIKLDVPQIAENGLVVPVSVEVESPMTEADYVKAVHVFADGNPLPGSSATASRPIAARPRPRPACVWPRPRTSSASPKCRTVRCFHAKAEVKVTIGGCGG
jgi:sulfur-oxidizing protein SoxY